MEVSLASETLDFEIQTDILTLLENVKCQGSNPSGLKQALLALANICSSNSASQEYFYLTGGVEELQTLLLEGCCPLSAVPAALYCLACAVRQNVTSQNAVLTERLFNLIHELLSHSNSSDRLLQSAAFLLACSVAGSKKGQLLADETGCLQDLVNLLRDLMTSGSEDENTWSSIIRAIGACVNNPQNDHNQQICCSMLPHILKFVSTESRHIGKCAGHVFALISSVVANNVPNQNRIRRCGGIEVLINFISDKVHVESTPLPLDLLVNAVSAVDACIADNGECGIQAATLGLVHILLDLLQTKDLELNQIQVFILTLAHVLESSNEYCQLVSRGQGYYMLVNYLTDCQDEELFKVIKYILTLCKTQGAHESGNGQQHYDVPDDYDGGHRHSKRDLTAFLKEGLADLSKQLNSIEKISEGIHWMTDVNMTAQPVNNFKPHSDISGNYSYTDQIPHYTFGEKTGNIVEWSRQDSLPLQNSFNDDRECQGLEITQNHSFAGHVKKYAAKESREIFQNSSLGSKDHTKGIQIIRPIDAEVEMVKVPGVDTNCKRVQDVSSNYQTKPSHGSSTQAQKNCNLAFGNAQRSLAYVGRSGDSDDLSCYQGFSKHKPVTISDISQDCSQKHWNTKCADDFQSHKETRPYAHCEEMPNSTCLQDQVSDQKHGYKEVDSGNTDTSPFCVKGKRRQHLTSDKELPYQKKISLYQQVQDCRAGNKVVTDCSPSHMEMDQQNCEAGGDMQRPAFDRQPCSHHREIDPVVHQQNESEYVHKAQNSICCERSIDKTVCPCLGASSTRHTITHSTPKSSSSHIRVPDFPDVQIFPESDSPMEENLEDNTCRNHRQEDSFKACVPPQENPLLLLSQVQKLMSSFFRSLLPGQVGDLPKQWKPGNHTSPAAQTSREQCQIVESPSCKSILSLCEEDDLLQKDQHQETPHACLSDTRQTFTDQASKLKNNNSVILQSDNGSLPEVQKYNSIQTVPTSSNCRNVCSPRDNTVDVDDRGRSVETSVPNKTVDKNKIFIKPSQPCLTASRTAINRRSATCVSNTRQASTPGTPLTAHTADQIPLPPSPALSLFDSQLRSMAHRGTIGSCVTTALGSTISQQPDDSTSGFESMCTSEAVTDMVPAWSLSQSKADGQTCKAFAALNQLQTAGRPTSQLPVNTTGENIPHLQDNVKSLSTHQSFLNELSRTRSKYVTNTVGSKHKSATRIKKRIHKKKQADIAGCSPQYSKSSSCPGCGILLNLNSCNYNIVIEASPYTCAYHRQVRQCERKYISQLLITKRALSVSKKGSEDTISTGNTAAHDVYEFKSDSEELMEVPCVIRPVTSKQDNGKMDRRPRVSYTEQEVLNLLEGVHQIGKHWQQILWTYQFHQSRTAVDLKDKYRQLKAKQTEQMKTDLPFSLCEIRRLKNGVRHFGYNWQAILKSYKFLPGRTAAHLHIKWRSLNRVESFSDHVDS